MPKIQLDPEEQELLDAYEPEQFESELSDERRDYLASAAEETFRKDRRISIRLGINSSRK